MSGDHEGLWSCPACTFENTAMADVCDICGAPRPGSWACSTCTLLNQTRADFCTACNTPRQARSQPKRGERWRPADHLLAARPPPRVQAQSQVTRSGRGRGQRAAPAYGRGQFVRSSCRLVLGGDPPCLWKNVWRVDMRCTELPKCPICLEDPCVRRVPECGHVLCLVCALRQMDNARTCAICGKGPILLEDLRPVQLEEVPGIQVGAEGVPFQLVRRVGTFVSLPGQPHPPAGKQIASEGEPGWYFSPKVRGDPGKRLDRIHSELRTLEAEFSESRDPVVRRALEHLQDELPKAMREHSGVSQEAAPIASLGSDDAVLVFYQIADGRPIFLEPQLTKQLLASFGSWGSLPHSLVLRGVTGVREEMVTKELQRWHRFLAHLPEGEVAFLEGEVDSPDRTEAPRRVYDETADRPCGGAGAHRGCRKGQGRQRGRGGSSCEHAYYWEPQSGYGRGRGCGRGQRSSGRAAAGAAAPREPAAE